MRPFFSFFRSPLNIFVLVGFFSLISGITGYKYAYKISTQMQTEENLELLTIFCITLEDVINLLTVRAKEKGLILNCNIQPDLPSLVKGDPGTITPDSTGGHVIRTKAFVHALALRP